MKIREIIDQMEHDPRIGTAHIALMVALLLGSGINGRIRFKAEDVMKRSKIRARDTFFRTINDLNNYGYLRYRPSRNHYKRLNEVDFN